MDTKSKCFSSSLQRLETFKSIQRIYEQEVLKDMALDLILNIGVLIGSGISLLSFLNGLFLISLLFLIGVILLEYYNIQHLRQGSPS